MRIGVGVGVEDSGIAAEGAQDVGGGFVAAKEVRWGLGAGEAVPDEQEHGALSSLAEVGAGLGEGLGWRLVLAHLGEE